MNIVISSMGNLNFGIPVLLKALTDEFTSRGARCFYLSVSGGKDIDGDEVLYSKLDIQASRININNPIHGEKQEYKNYSRKELDDMIHLSYKTDELLNRENKRDIYLENVKTYLENLKKLDEEHPIDLFIVWGMRIRERTIYHYAKKHGIKIYVFEHGYFRPFTLTVDSKGVNAENSVPRTREFYEKIDFDQYRFEQYLNRPEAAVCDDQLSNKIQTIWESYKRSRIGARQRIRKEWYRIRKLTLKRAIRKLIKYPIKMATIPLSKLKQSVLIRYWNKAANRVLHEGKPYIFVPFQLQTDSQIVLNSPNVKLMKDMTELIASTVDEYNRRNQTNYRVIFKPHPLYKSKDPAFRLMDIMDICNKYKCGKLTTNIDTPTLIEHSDMVITVNSTVGIEALTAGKKVVTLGDAFYNIDGIVYHANSPEKLYETIEQAIKDPRDDELINKFLYYIRFHYFFEIYYLNPDQQSIKRLVDKLMT